ncbi:UNVERIFIED_CONTAM: hypothetical protein Slati_0001000 [Sesamum latifolium]|uniref:Uncharacterized protein n=1 Tax=Sesamum latifolium TaxID=2727402 RepID=A0AAW2Y5T5_9LAMI
MHSSSLGDILIWLYPDDPSMKDNASCPVVASTMSSMIGKGKSSFGHALFKSRKSTQIQNLAILFVDRHDARNPRCIFDFSDESSIDKLVYFCLNTRDEVRAKNSLRLLYRTSSMSYAKVVNSDFWSKPGISLYVHAKTSLYSSKVLKYCSSSSGQECTDEYRAWFFCGTKIQLLEFIGSRLYAIFKLWRSVLDFIFGNVRVRTFINSDVVGADDDFYFFFI